MYARKAEFMTSSLHADELRRHIAHSRLLADVAEALIGAQSLRSILQLCCEAMVQRLDAAFARIWTLNSVEDVLELQASAGMYTHINGPHGRVPVGKFKIGRIAQENKPHLTNDVLTDSRISDPEWARREGMVSFAGYPLTIGGHVIGVMAMFARQALADDTLDALAAVADAVALGIERSRADEARRLFQALVETSGDFIGFTNPSGKLVYLNEAGRALVGLGAEENARDRSLDQFVLAAERAQLQAILNDVLQGQRWTGETTFFNARTGEPVITQQTVLPIADDTGEISAIATVARDMRALKAAEEMQRAEQERRRELIVALERSNRELDQFAYVASHDLKAPLRGIANLSQWLEEDLEPHLTEESRQQLKLLRGRVHRLEALIDGILSYSRAGRKKTERKKVVLSRLIDGVIQHLSPAADAILDVQPDLPVLYAERVPLEQVFMNLIGNALKHGGAPAHVRIGARRAGDWYEFFVSDRGPGIAPEFHERIWGIFQTLERRDVVEGTGIGLAVVRKIVESQGGKTWVDSALGEGATFWFSWPVGSEDFDGT